MTNTFVTIFVIIMMAMAVTLIRAQPAHSFAIWMLTCYQDHQEAGPPTLTEPAILTNVDPDPGLEACKIDLGPNNPPTASCAGCLNALGNGSKKAGVINITITESPLVGDGGSLIQILIGL